MPGEDQNKTHCEATAQAADVLAILYLARGDYPSAKRAVDDGLKIFAGYQPMQTAYIEKLLRNRLAARASEAQKLYEAAEKLRNSKKYLEAGRLYVQLLTAYPKDPISHAANFRMGECLVGLERPAQALELWRKFLKDMPAGPWRGQARVASADLLLEQLDLAGATEHIRQAAAVLDNLATLPSPVLGRGAGGEGERLPSPVVGRGAGGEGERLPSPVIGRGAGGEGSLPADHSWQDAASDIRLRQGILALLNQQYEAASAALKLAANSPRSPGQGPASTNSPRSSGQGPAATNSPRPYSGEGQGVRAGIDRLLRFADKKTSLLPTDLGSTDRGVGLALALGRIAALMGRGNQAAMLFASVQSGRVKGASPAQVSFAALGLARAIIALKEPVRAKQAYLLSLKATDKPAWHDGTLRELALLIEHQALVVPPLGGILSKSGASGGIPPKGGTTSAVAAEALPFWQKLIAEHAASPYAPEALYHAARLQFESDQWRAASENLEKLVKDYPTAPWAGDAHVALIDIKLERLLDLEGAQKNADAAVQWYEKTPPRPLEVGATSPRSAGDGRDARSPLALGEGKGEGRTAGDGQGEGVKVAGAEDPFSPFPAALARPLREVAYDIYLRAGLLEYLHEQFGAALVLFEKAKPFAPPQNFVVAYGKISTGIERLIDVAKTGKSITPEVVRKGNPTAKTALMLADIYHEAQQYEKSLELCNRLLNGTAIQRATPEQRSYAHFRRARNHYRSKGKDFDFEAAYADYSAAVKAAPKAPWASQAMFLAANIQWNQKHDAEAAATLWKRLAHDYPDTKDADASTLFLSVVLRWTNRPEEAKEVLKDFLQKRPDSPLAAGARMQLEKLPSISKDKSKPSPAQTDADKAHPEPQQKAN